MNVEDLEGLSEEERAALEDDEYGDAPDGEDLLEDEAPEEDEAQEEAQEEAPEEDEAPVYEKEFIPVYTADPVADYETRMKQITEANREIAAGYEAGDFDLEEYQLRQRKLTELEWSLREANLKASLAAEQQQQSLAQRWQWEQDRFFSVGANRAYREDPIVGAAFSTAVQSLAANAENDSKPMAWFLEEADRITRSRFRLGNEPVADNVRPIRKRPTAPPTLAGVPAAALPETGEPDEFAKLDRMSGMELEQALARLSQAEADRYLMDRVA